MACSARHGTGMIGRRRARFASLIKRVAGLRRRRRGAAAVEFALMMPVILLALAGVTDFGRLVFDKMELTSAVRSGAQFALAYRTDTTGIRQSVVDATNLGLSLSDVTATESCECADGSTVVCGEVCGDASSNRYLMTITAQQSFSPLFVPFSMIEYTVPSLLSATTTIRTQ